MTPYDVPFDLVCPLCGEHANKTLMRGTFLWFNCVDVAACAVRQASSRQTPLPEVLAQILYLVQVDAMEGRFCVVGAGEAPAMFRVHFLEPISAARVCKVLEVLERNMPCGVVIEVTERNGP